MTYVQRIYASSPAPLQHALLSAYALGIRWHRYGRAYRRAIPEFLVHEHWPPERLREYQVDRLRKVLAAAERHSPYYRGLFAESGFRPATVREPDDLHALPLLTKQVVRERERSLMTRSRPRALWHNGHTSGTTGTPLSVWYDRWTCVVNNVVDWRQKAWAGMPHHDWIGLLLGRVVVPLGRPGPPFWRYNPVLKQVWFSSFHLSDETLPAYVGEIRRRGLAFLEGYPSTLYVLARYLVRNGEHLPMRAVFSSSETLLPIQRATIEEAFGCRLFDFYGLAERVIFAGECDRHEGKHIAEDFGLVEVVNVGGSPVPPGTPGYLVGTSLHNTAMPMIRYRTSDVSAVILDECPCGRQFRRLRNVTTKAEDFVITPEGKLISPSVLTHPFKPLHGIAESQIVQDRLDRIVVKLVPLEHLPDEEVAKLVTALRERIGPTMQIEIDEVTEIPRSPSGKLRWVISTVPHDYRLSWEGEPA